MTNDSQLEQRPYRSNNSQSDSHAEKHSHVAMLEYQHSQTTVVKKQRRLQEHVRNNTVTRLGSQRPLIQSWSNPR